jgi:drug/metabolite transporter (DMT)-like permease
MATSTIERPANTKQDLRMRRLGVALVAASAVCWSTAGLFVRVADLDSATLIVWSAIAACLGLGLVCAVRLGRYFLREIVGIGISGVLYVTVAAVCSISYIISLRYTTVANVMTIYAALPFLATAIAFFWLRERVSRPFVIAGAFAMAGVAITAGAAATTDDIIGLVAGFVMTASFAAQLVFAKRYPKMDILLVSAISAGVTAIIAAPFMNTDVVLTPMQLTGSALYGLIPYGLGTALALAGGRLVKSGEAGFIAMLDVVLGPVWVWLFFSEQPAVEAVIGGTMVLCAVAWYLSKEGNPASEA